MDQIVPSGSINTSALSVPDLYIQIVPPAAISLNGVASNVIGVVGSASWGPVNTPVILSGSSDAAIYFGGVKNRTFDLCTQVALASAQGANAFLGVRVTDGTDTAALTYLGGNSSGFSVLLTAIYSGSQGNNLSVALTQGAKASSFSLSIGLPNGVPEVFSNIDASAGATTFWQNLAAAVNGGQGGARGPSRLIVATAGATAATPAAIAASLMTGGTDGASGVTSQTLIGANAAPRTGIYALANTGISYLLPADLTDLTTWSTVLAWAIAHQCYAIVPGPKGDTITNAVATKAAAGVDGYGLKCIFGDWMQWSDTTNLVARYVSPAGFAAGRLAQISPANAGLNKPIYGIMSSQKSGSTVSGQSGTYSETELATLFQAGWDVICTPQPGGNYWGLRSGHNAASNVAIQSDSYTTMTNYIASTLGAGMGIYVGALINATLFTNIRSTLLGYLGNLLGQGILGSLDGSIPYSVTCDTSNNPLSRTSLGYVQADIAVQYQGINEKFIVNLQGGSSVQVSSSTQQASLGLAA